MSNLSTINKIVYLINILVALVLFLALVLPFLPPKTFSLLSVLNLGVPFLILINVLFFLYWLVRVRKQLMVSLVVLVIGQVVFGSLYKFSSSKRVESPSNFKVMNYNVRLFNLFEWIPEDNIDTKIIDFIKKEAPAILCIQDYHLKENRDLSFFKYKYEYLSGKKINFGQAIFSQYPIINSGSLNFPNTSNNAIFVDVVKDKDTIRIYNVHLESMHINAEIDSLKKEKSEFLINRISSTFKMQQSQTELLLTHKEQSKFKTIICGDLNNTAFSYVYRKMRGDLNDTFIKAGNGFGRTYAFQFFPVRIDYIFADNAFSVNGFKAYNEQLSDHYPISTTLSLEN